MQILLKDSLLIKDDANKTVLSRLLEVTTIVTEWSVRKVKIAASTVDAAIDFGGVSNVAFLLLTSDLPVSMKINGSATSTSKGNFFLFTGATGGFLTSLSVSNPDIEDANIEVTLGGN